MPFEQFIGYTLDPDQEAVLICDTDSFASDLIDRLLKIGYYNIKGFVLYKNIPSEYY